jgi:thiol-disulfide isomerase/thioredoxin
MSNKTRPRATTARPATRPSAVRRAEQRRTSRRVILAVVGGAIAIAAIGAIAISATGDTADAGPQTRPVEIAGSALPEYTGGDDTALGTTAPELRGASFDGTPVSITADGRAKVVTFIAHWCPHCQAEVPRITEWLADSGMPTDVDLYAVATGTSSDLPNYPPSEWLDGESWPITTMADDADSRAAGAFGLSSYPYFVVLDGDGTVLARTSGELTEEQFRALLATAVNE